jgi:ribosomal protein S19E (S16A)
MTLGQAEEYLLETYGLKWSRPYWRKLIRTGQLRGRQVADRGWWYVTRESIDDLLGTPR